VAEYQANGQTASAAWTPNGPTVTTEPPYRVSVGRVWHTGAAAGQTFTAGRDAGGVYTATAEAGRACS
jgi:hypothetical protein